GEKRIAAIRAGRREYLYVAAPEKSLNLVLSAPDGRRRSDDLRTNNLIANGSRAQLIQRRFVKAHHRSNRPGDQMEFILNNQIRCRQFTGRQRGTTAGMAWAVESFPVVTINAPEKRADFSGPGHRGELVHRCNHEARQPAIDGVIHPEHGDRLPATEIAMSI